MQLHTRLSAAIVENLVHLFVVRENGALPVGSKTSECIGQRVRLYTVTAMSAGTRFTIAIFLHLVGMVGLFIGYGLEWVASSLLPRSTNAEQVRAWLNIYRVSPYISGAGLLFLILSGVYFASIFEAMKEGWLLSSLLATVFVFGIGFAFILSHVRRLRAELPEGNSPLSEAGLASVQDPVMLTLIRVRFLLTLGILYLMITKPDVATSLFILLGTMVVGVISAATAWTPCVAFLTRIRHLSVFSSDSPERHAGNS